MVVQITSDNFEYYFGEYFESYFLNTYGEYSSALENDEEILAVCDVIIRETDMTNALAVPGVMYDRALIKSDGTLDDKAQADRYIQIPWAVLANALKTMNDAAAAVEGVVEGAERVDADLDGTELTVTRRDGSTKSVDTASAAKEAKAEWDNTYKPQIIAATSSANTAAQGASNVNAGLVGFTVTITDRNGTSHSVDIGFEIYRTYQSIAAMNADAANVPQGKFVVIATTSATDPDNAKMYCKNSQGSFTFMSDLDQASSAAWADWLDNMKPQIESAISTADSDHTRAGQDHQTAQSDHTTATSDHNNYTADRQTFQVNEAQRQQTFETNEATRQQDFEDAEDERMANMMLTHCFVDFATMSLMFVQPQNDTTEYKVRNGNLNITFQYDA